MLHVYIYKHLQWNLRIKDTLHGDNINSAVVSFFSEVRNVLEVYREANLWELGLCPCREVYYIMSLYRRVHCTCIPIKIFSCYLFINVMLVTLVCMVIMVYM